MEEHTTCDNFKLSPREITKRECRRAVRDYAQKVVEECQQQGFTISQFEFLVEILEGNLNSLKTRAADTTKM